MLHHNTLLSAGTCGGRQREYERFGTILLCPGSHRPFRVSGHFVRPRAVPRRASDEHNMIPFSVLDLSPITVGATATQAFRNTLDLAQHAEQWGYLRYWLAEHHNMTGIASAATSVVIGHVAGGTKTIRVGSGGVMLPNHAPLVIAEQFGTLESLYPGRIDLGLGRAPGTDQTTARALRRDLHGSAESFPDDVVELQRFFSDAVPGQRVRAVPGAGLHVPIWLLGSSLFSAQLAAALGLPFAFASHFAPDHMLTALRIYRAQFRPSATLAKPYAMVGVNLFAADTNEAAQRLFTSLQQQFVNLRRGTPGQLQAPVERIEATEMELSGVAHSLSCSVIGERDAVREGLLSVIEQTGADELMLTAQIYDHAARLRSFEIAAQVREEIAGSKG
ncbi:luciferase family oxidoreductase group 1 [Paraburkholderia sp. GAS448]